MEVTLLFVPEKISTTLTISNDVTTVVELKQLIYDLHGLVPEEYKLVTAGRILEDNMKLLDGHLVKGGVIYMIPRGINYQALLTKPLSEFGYLVRNEVAKQVKENGQSSKLVDELLKLVYRGIKQTATQNPAKFSEGMSEFDLTEAMSKLSLKEEHIAKAKLKKKNVNLLSVFTIQSLIARHQNQANIEELFEVLKEDLTKPEALLVGSRDQDAIQFVNKFITDNVAMRVHNTVKGSHLWDFKDQFEERISLENFNKDLEMSDLEEDFKNKILSYQEALRNLSHYHECRAGFKPVGGSLKMELGRELYEEASKSIEESQEIESTVKQVNFVIEEIENSKLSYSTATDYLIQKDLSSLERLDQEGVYLRTLLKMILKREVERNIEYDALKTRVQNYRSMNESAERKANIEQRRLRFLTEKLTVVVEDNQKKVAALTELSKSTAKVFETLDKYVEKESEIYTYMRNTALLNYNQVIKNQYEVLYGHCYGRENKIRELKGKLEKYEKKVRKAKRYAIQSDLVRYHKKHLKTLQEIDKLISEKDEFSERLEALNPIILDLMTRAKECSLVDSVIDCSNLEEVVIPIEDQFIKHPKMEIETKFLQEELEEIQEEQMKQSLRASQIEEHQAYLQRIIKSNSMEQNRVLSITYSHS